MMGSGAAAFEELAAPTGGRAIGDGDGGTLMGDFPYVIEGCWRNQRLNRRASGCRSPRSFAHPGGVRNRQG